MIAGHGDLGRRGEDRDWMGECSRLARMRGLGSSTCGESSDGLMEVTGGEVSWKPVGTSWVNCRLWITFPPMYPLITFRAHLECNLNI